MQQMQLKYINEIRSDYFKCSTTARKDSAALLLEYYYKHNKPNATNAVRIYESIWRWLF